MDEIKTFTVPVVLGGGKKLFANGSAPHACNLIRSRVASSGVIVAHYEWAGNVKTDDTALGKPSKTEIARRESMKREG